MNRSLAAELASRTGAYISCCNANNQEWQVKHKEEIERLLSYLPHGSGLDGENSFDYERSNGERLIIHTSYHHMDNGMYDGWTDHTITATPGFNGINIKVSGRDRNEIKEYLAEIFAESLESNNHALTVAA